MSVAVPQTLDACRFEALIVPHRSLSRRGLRILTCSLVGLTGVIALRFLILGAWPVLAISGPEIGIVLFLLRLNARRARASELVLLGDDTLRITRTDPSGQRQECSLPVPWLNVVLEEAPNSVPRLLLRNRQACEEIGRALGEEEKRDLANALRAALHEVRHPRFDNPQLRDGVSGS
jgi:uncharacterized membrane protein